MRAKSHYAQEANAIVAKMRAAAVAAKQQAAQQAAMQQKQQQQAQLQQQQVPAPMPVSKQLTDEDEEAGLMKKPRGLYNEEDYERGTVSPSPDSPTSQIGLKRMDSETNLVSVQPVER